MNAAKLLIAAAALVLIGLPHPVYSQFGPPEGGRGGDRGGDREGDRGGDRGGFRGGPPGGFRGGPPGGSRGGSRGGFDPSGFLSRLDRNGNGVLDPDEQQGPAQFLIRRLESADSSIKPGQPIPLKRVTEAFEKMRGGGNDRSRGQSSGSDDDGLSAELLVPGFGVELEPPQLMGFGPTAEMLSVTVTDEDREEASERMRRYDRNRDGVLTPNELQRFSGNPMDFDRNKDGKLSERELAVRYARRRESREDSRDNDRDRRRDRDRDRDVEPPDVYDGRKSYRATAGRELPEGVPGFFADKDSNGDGQVEMAEFATKWNDETVREFFRSDLNRDGIITAEEALRAVEEGDDQAPSSDQTASSSASTDGSESSGGTIGEPDAKMIAYAERIVSRQDENKDGKLTPSEWKKMLLSPADADADRDGTITVKEYAWWMQSRSKR